jgi:hypothetical protein
MDSTEIEEVVERLLFLLKNGTPVTEIQQMPEFDTFKTRNKIFFETIINGQHDPVIFKKMMQMKRKLESGSTQYEVDVKFGKFMAEKYIDPVIK